MRLSDLTVGDTIEVLGHAKPSRCVGRKFVVTKIVPKESQVYVDDIFMPNDRVALRLVGKDLYFLDHEVKLVKKQFEVVLSDAEQYIKSSAYASINFSYDEIIEFEEVLDNVAKVRNADGTTSLIRMSDYIKLWEIDNLAFEGKITPKKLDYRQNFFTDTKKVIYCQKELITKFGTRVLVVGKALCDGKDEFNYEKGTEIASVRADVLLNEEILRDLVAHS